MQAWEKFITTQEIELGKDTVQKWLKTLKVLHFDACNLYLEAKDPFQAMWFEEHIRTKVTTKLFNNNRKRIQVHLAVANIPTQKQPSRSKALPAATPAPQFILNFDQLDPCCLFEHYAIFESNLLISKLFQELCQGKQHSFNPIFIHGPSGSGKTHLLMALANQLKSQNKKVIYSRTQTFTDHVVSAIRAGEMSIFRQAYRNIDVLIIDDAHVFSRKGATQEEFFHTFNTLHLADKQIILSANCPPGELSFIEPRLISRFEWGIVLPLEPLSKEELLEILQKKAQAMHCSLNGKIAEFLIENFKNSKSLCRALEALILRTHLKDNSAETLLSNLTIPLAKQLLSDLILEEEKNALTASVIIQKVAEFFGIRAEDILGKAQTRDCVLPRQLAMYFCRNQLKMPYVKIGDLFKKDHSTVISSVKLIQKGIDVNDEEVASAYQTIFKRLKSP